MKQFDSDSYGIFSEQMREVERWTYDDAQVAEQEWMARGGAVHEGASRAGVSPVIQWSAWTKELPRLGERYKATGDFKIIFEAVTICINFRLPLPPWCAVPLRSAWNKIDNFEHRSWDDVFGKPHKGAQIAARKRHLDIGPVVVLEILDLIDSGGADVESIKTVANDRGLSYEVARDWYYEHCAQYPITETLMSDGWFYRKSTGEPDLAYKKHRPANDRKHYPDS